MTVLYCTRRLLDVLGTCHDNDSEVTASASDNRLGTWTATLLPLRPVRFVLAISEHASLPLVLEALPYPTALDRLPAAVYELLLALKLPPDLARRERADMQPLHLSPTGNNSMLAMLKTYAIELRSAWENGLSRSPSELSAHLALTSFEHMEGATPGQAVRRRFHLLPDRTEPLGL